MMYTKKMIRMSGALIITGVSMMSMHSALAMTEMSMTGSGGSDMNKPMPDPYAECLAYVKLKNLTGVDCKAKAEAMRQENKDARMEMNQGIKDDRMKMNEGIKDDRMKMMEGNKQNRQMMGSDQMMHSTGELKNFIKTPLGAEEQAALKALMQSHQAERDAVMKDTTLTPEQKAAKMKELMTAHMTSMLVYISTDKQEAFKKMMADNMAMMEKNKENRQEFRDGAKEQRQDFNNNAKEQRQDFKNDMKAKKQALSDKNKALLTKAVDSLSLEKLQTILTKVEKALAVSKKERVIAQLNEINDIIQAKIDELTGTSSEDDVVNSILGTEATVTQ